MKYNKVKVLHILPHVGGGVGSVIRALMKAEVSQSPQLYSHSIVTLEMINGKSKDYFDELGIQLTECGTNKKIRELTNDADIVLIHWWNHPLLMRLLFEGLPPSRLALWSHVNGFAAPQSFFSELFRVSDLFVFATKASLDAPIVKNLLGVEKDKLRVIRSCAGIPPGALNTYPKKDPFQFGYIGTVESAKMCSNFIQLCAAAKLTSPCIVAGGPDHDKLRSQVDQLGLVDQFKILGYVDDPTPIFKSLHALAYPLNPRHYGTGEQVLIEAMSYGVVPVVLSNPPESTIIRHNKTGIIANTEEEFTNALRFLAKNPDERDRLAEAGRKFVFEECDIKLSVKEFHLIYKEMLSFPKSSHQLNIPGFDGVVDGSPLHLFLTSCGDDSIRDYFKQPGSKTDLCSVPQEFMSMTRGTPQHYLTLLGHDPNLEFICNAYCRGGEQQ